LGAGEQIDEQYIETGRVRHVFRDLPLISIHSEAVAAAEAARCAGEVAGSEGYWGMHRALFEGQAEWAGSEDADDIFKGYAAGLDLDVETFDVCVDEGQTEEAVLASMQEAASLGLNGTPAFTLGEGQLFGALPFEEFQNAFEIVLAGGSLPTPTPPPTPDLVEVDAPRMEIDPGDAPAQGDPDAPLTIVEFSEYQCPYCGAYTNETYPMVIEEFVDTGRARYVFVDFPLKNIHADAVTAGAAAHCARDQGGDEAYFAMHHELFANQQEWAVGVDNVPELLGGYADDIDLDGDELIACIEAGTHEATVDEGFNKALEAQIGGTPTFFINGYMMAGAYPPDMFREILEKVEAGEAPTIQMPREQAEQLEQLRNQEKQQDQDSEDSQETP
jgi:protein-disulfide isomerase